MTFYKETEFQISPIGEIPKGWQATKLTEVADYVNGFGFSPNDWKTEGLPIIRIQNLTDSSTEFNYFEGKIDDRYFVKSGDLLFAWSASIGCHIWDRGDAWLNQHIFKVVPKQGFDKQYLYYALFSAIEQLGKSVHGSTMQHFKRGELERTLIPMPLENEQKAIVGILGVSDSAIALADQVIAKTELLKKGLMQQLLSQGIGYTEYKDSPIGRIPQTWEITTIDKECSVGTGGTPSRNIASYFGGKIPWVKSTEVDYGVIAKTEETLTEQGVQNSNAKVYPSGSLVIALYGQGRTRGKCAILGIDAAINQACAVIQSKGRIDIRYLFYWCQNSYSAIRGLSQGANQANLNMGIIRALDLPLPTMSEQKKISEILSTVDTKLEIEKSEKAKLQRIRQALMDLLLSGKVRIKED